MDHDPGIAVVIGQSCQRPDGSLDLSHARRQATDAAVPDKGTVYGGEVLINSTGTGTLGRVAMLRDVPPEPTFVDSHVTLLRVDPRRADARFLAAGLGLPASRLFIEDALSAGATKQRELSVEALRAHVVPLPAPDAQRAVADFLDRERERVDNLDSKCTSIEPVLGQSALARFVELTRHRPVTRLGYHYEVQLGKMLDEGRGSRAELVPYLRNQNVGWDRFDLDDVKLMPLGSAEKARYRVRPGDLLACEGRHVGKSAVWDGEVSPMYFQKALHRVRPRGSWSTRYLMWCLWVGNVRGDFYADGTGSTIPHLPAEKLRAVRIPWADRVEQDEIVRQVDEVHETANAAQSAAAEFRERLTEYRDALITEAVTGKLDVTKLSDAQLDESAHAASEGETPEVLAS